MSSSRNSGPGMRVLWIPGKKKQHHKGVYTSTSKEIGQRVGQRHGNQAWNLGGTQHNNKIINSVSKEDMDSGTGMGHSALSALGHSAHLVEPLSIAAGGVAVASTSTIPLPEIPETIPEEKCGDTSNLRAENSAEEDNLLEKEHLETSDVSNVSNVSTNAYELHPDELNEEEDKHSNNSHSYHTHATLALRKKTGSNNTDLDSIEHLDDDELKNMANIDDIDSVSMNRVLNSKSHNRTKNHNEEEKNKKLVDCLYYAMMCCECSIS